MTRNTVTDSALACFLLAISGYDQNAGHHVPFRARPVTCQSGHIVLALSPFTFRSRNPSSAAALCATAHGAWECQSIVQTMLSSAGERSPMTHVRRLDRPRMSRLAGVCSLSQKGTNVSRNEPRSAPKTRSHDLELDQDLACSLSHEDDHTIGGQRRPLEGTSG